jgi:hypothetical protein
MDNVPDCDSGGLGSSPTLTHLKIIKDLIVNQKPLDKEFEYFLNDNFWELLA